MENGYHMYTFSGAMLSENPTEKFKQFLWRPRPPTLLSKEEQKTVRRTLREYSREFDEEDRYAVDIANTQIVEERQRLLNEWYSWMQDEQEQIKEEREELGMTDAMAELEMEKNKSKEEDQTAVVEEIVEEIIEETEEIIG